MKKITETPNGWYRHSTSKEKYYVVGIGSFGVTMQKMDGTKKTFSWEEFNLIMSKIS